MPSLLGTYHTMDALRRAGRASRSFVRTTRPPGRGHMVCEAQRTRRSRTPEDTSNTRVLQNYIQHVFQSQSDVETIGLSSTDESSHGYKGFGGRSASSQGPSRVASRASFAQGALAVESDSAPSLQSSFANGRGLPTSDSRSVAAASAQHDGGLMSPEDAAMLALEGPEVVIRTEPPACSVQHPGIVSCSTTTVLKNPQQHFCLITIKALTRVTSDAPQQFTVDDLAAIGARALKDAAAAEAQRNISEQQKNHLSRDTLQQHEDLKNILKYGKIVEATKNPVSQFGHESYNLKLRDRHTGRVIDALFKPRIKGDSEGWHRVPIEYVAYEMAQLLGMDYVPPVAYRDGGIDVDYTRYQEGAFIYYAKNARALKNYPSNDWNVPRDVLLSDTRILDVLLHNSDRHHGHFLFGEHWVDGHYDRNGQWHGAYRPILIDHAAGFRPEAVVTLEHENAFQTGPVRCVSSRTYLRLRFLDAQSVRRAVGQHLSDAEVAGLLKRRDNILRYIDNLVDQHGYSAVVVE